MNAGTFGYFRTIHISKSPAKKEKGGRSCPRAITHRRACGLERLNFPLGFFFFSFDVNEHNVYAICYYGRAEQTSIPTRAGEPACLASLHNWWTCCCVFDPAVWYVMPPAPKLIRHWISRRERPPRCYFVCLGDTTVGFFCFSSLADSNIPPLFLSRPTPCGAVKCQ